MMITVAAVTHAEDTIADLENRLEGSAGRERAEILNKLAALLLAVDLDQAVSHAEEAAKAARESGDGLGQAQAAKTLGVASYQVGDYRQAIVKTRQSLALTLEHDLDSLAIDNLHNLSIFHRLLAEYDESLDYLETILEEFSETADPARMARAHGQIGKVRYMQGDLDKALDHSLSALRINEELEDAAGVADSMNTVAVIHDELGNSDVALDYYLRSLKIFEALGDERGIVDPLNNIGAIFYVRGDLDQAEEYQLRALDIRRRNSDHSGIAVSLNNLGNIAREREDLDGALAYYGEALTIKEELQDRSEIVISLRDIGDIHRTAGRFDAALEVTLRSLNMAREIKAASHIKVALRDLASIYEDMGDHAAALSAYKEYHDLEKEIIGKEASAAVAELQVKYEAEKNEKEIENLRKQGMLNRRIQYSFVAVLALTLLIMSLVWNRYRLNARANDLLRRKNLTIEEQNRRLEELNVVLEGKSQEYYANSIQDALTEVYNKAYILDDLSKAFSLSRRHLQPMACAFFDLDHFKAVNDTYGHLVGDRVLKKVAAAIDQHIRTEDTLGRYGGEEFLLVLPNTTIEGARVVAEKIREQVERIDFSGEGLDGPISISAGIAEVNEHGASTAEELLHQADTALYDAKTQGRNRSSAFVVVAH